MNPVRQTDFKKIHPAVLALAAAVLLAGCASAPPRRPDGAYTETGLASYYAEHFHGRATASGEIYNMHALTAAHPHLPFGTHVFVTNLKNRKRVKVRINDRGPFVRGRIIDVSRAAADRLGMLSDGVVQVRVVKVD
jgi:rare lipoprotein A